MTPPKSTGGSLRHPDAPAEQTRGESSTSSNVSRSAVVFVFLRRPCFRRTRGQSSCTDCVSAPTPCAGSMTLTQPCWSTVLVRSRQRARVSYACSFPQGLPPATSPPSSTSQAERSGTNSARSGFANTSGPREASPTAPANAPARIPRGGCGPRRASRLRARQPHPVARCGRLPHSAAERSARATASGAPASSATTAQHAQGHRTVFSALHRTHRALVQGVCSCPLSCDVPTANAVDSAHPSGHSRVNLVGITEYVSTDLLTRTQEIAPQKRT